VKEIKPRLISAKPTKRGKTRFESFLVLLFVFVIGVFVGMKIKSIDIKEIEFAKKKDTEVMNSKAGAQIGKKPYEENLAAIGEGVSVKEEGSNVVATNPATPVNDNTKGLKTRGESDLGKRYTLQIAAFKDTDVERAEKLANELKDRGYYAYITPVYDSIKRETWNLIRIGKFKTREEAREFATVFQEREGMEAIVKELK
jgi:hypothetical protein